MNNNSPYGKPIQEGPSNPTEPNDQTQAIIVNQAQPVVIAPLYTRPRIGASPVFMNCPNCKTQITTNVVKKWSWGACCLCCWTGALIWIIIQLCREKDITCYDATHTCPNCGKLIYQFESC